jgi:hypothetical protein
MGGGRKPSQSGSLSRTARAPLAYPTILADQAGSKHTGDSQTAPNQGRGPVAPDAGVAGDAVAQVARSRGLVRWLAEPRTPSGGTCLARRAFDFDRPPDLNAREHKPGLPRGREVYRY